MCEINKRKKKENETSRFFFLLLRINKIRKIKDVSIDFRLS